MTAPQSVWRAFEQLDRAVVDLQRAMLHSDSEQMVASLDKIYKARNQLVNELQAWRPELRISA